jgi:hypothetical protein
MKEALTLFMLAMLIVPLLVAVRRIRRLPPAPVKRPGDDDGQD